VKTRRFYKWVKEKESTDLWIFAFAIALAALNPDFAIGLRTEPEKRKIVSSKKVTNILIVWKEIF